MDPHQVDRILVIKFWGIGSLVLAEPFFRTVRETFPNAHVHLLTLSSNRGALDLIAGIDHAHFVDLGNNLMSAIGAYIGTLVRVFKGRYDVVFDMEFYTRASAVTSLAAWAPVRVGYHAQGIYRGSIQSHPIPFNNYWHVSRNFLSLLEPFGVAEQANEPVPVLTLPETLHDDARAVLDRMGGDGARYIVVNVNAGELAYERRWFPDRFDALTAKLSQRFDLDCVFIGAPSEHDYVEAVVRSAKAQGARAYNAAGAVDLTGMAQICARSRLVISNDSGPLHVAAATGVPVVGFFGPETPVLYGPAGKDHLVLYSDVKCSPCINIEQGKRIKCRFAVPKCQLDISVDDACARITARYGAALEA